MKLLTNNELKEISLTEPTTAIYLEVNKQDLTTVVENENVEIRAVLDTSNTNYVLYKNPTLKIKFPSYIAKFKLNSYDILMSNGLKIKKQLSSDGLIENKNYYYIENLCF